jgi:hypothetical protein
MNREMGIPILTYPGSWVCHIFKIPGQGYGVEAARRFLSYCRDELGTKDIIAMCAPTNELLSREVAKRRVVHMSQ